MAALAPTRKAPVPIEREPYRDNANHSKIVVLESDQDSKTEAYFVGGSTLLSQAETPKREIERDLS